MRELNIPAKMENLEIMIEFILEAIENIGDKDKIKGKLRLISEEILVNVINYAYPEKTGNIYIGTELLDDILSLKIIDQGIKFDPLERQDPDINLPLEDRTIGGLGIFMVKNIMDEVKYSYEDGNNILILKKKVVN